MRTQQQWHILAPRLRQIERLSPPNDHWTSNPKSFLFDEKQTWNAWTKLARYPPITFAEGSTEKTTSAKRHYPDRISSALEHSTSKSPLESLPAELIALILSHSELTKDDIVALGSCSEQMCLHITRHIKEDCRKTAAVWAGTEIACTGSYLKDLPPSFENDDMMRKTIGTIHEDRRMAVGRQINWAAVSQYEKIPEDVRSAWRAALRTYSTEKRLSSRLACILAASPTSVPHGFAWVLRNLTTNELVQLISGKDGRVNVQARDVDWLCLDDLLLMRICWTIEDLYGESVGVEKKLHRGSWAGHCFDIVMVLEADISLDGWKNTTKEVVNEARELRRRLKSQKRIYSY